MSRVDGDATAFNHRDVPYSFLSLGVCPDPAEADKCIRWGRELWEAMQPSATGGVFVNYLGQEADEGMARVRLSKTAACDRLAAARHGGIEC